ncbi:MAG: EAL domain-containing protein [Acidobacteria bacterium]|nr:EAL domain-containing protein [Acidobacteriota bacterium]
MTDPRTESPPHLLLAAAPDLRTHLADAFSSAGFTVTTTTTCADVCAACSDPAPHVVVLDPELDGDRSALQAILELRAQPWMADVPVLLLIPDHDAAAVHQGQEAGASDFATRSAPTPLLCHRAQQMLRVTRTLHDLRNSESSLAQAQRIARLGNWIWDPQEDRVVWSAEVHRLLGVPDSIRTAPMAQFLDRVHTADQAAVRVALDQVLRGLPAFAIDLQFVQKGGQTRVLHAQGEAVHDEHGRATRVMGTLQDITERTAAEKRIKFLAYYDSLTHLPNRVLFTERLRGMIATARRRGQLVATVFVDLDNFKSVNDTMGHTAGDELLKVVADRFRDTTRDSDLFTRDRHGDGETHTVARLGGDEFILAIGDLERVEDVPRIARRLQNALKQPITLAPYGEVFVTTSMGISVFPQDGQSVEELFKTADAALYHAKDSGRDCFQFFSSALNDAALQRLLLEGHLRRAVQNDELVAYFQPQVDGRTNRVVAVEALMRWNRPEAGLIAPAQFIHVAEESGSIHELGRWILHKSSSESMARGWHARGVNVAVNISAQQFKRPDVVDTLLEAVTASRLSPSAVSLEITESVLADHARSVPTLRALKEAGFSLILDDFGTGYSSLTYLKALPLDALKIDRSFIRNITTDPRDAAIVTAIIGVARSLSMDVVAEGVERTAQKDKLLELGCPVMQGYLFGRPVPVDQLIC